MNSKKKSALVATLLLIAPLAAQASLIGEQVTGSLRFSSDPNNYFDSLFGLVPLGCLNSPPSGTTTVTISDSADEFCFVDGSNLDIANFTAGGLVVKNSVFSQAVQWTMSFTSSTTGLFSSLVLQSTTFDPGLVYGLAGDTITISWAGTETAGLRSATFLINSAAPVPEPGSLALLGLGLAGLGFARRRSSH